MGYYHDGTSSTGCHAHTSLHVVLGDWYVFNPTVDQVGHCVDGLYTLNGWVSARRGLGGKLLSSFIIPLEKEMN